MHVHAAVPIMSSIYLMHFHSAKLRSHPLRVLCTCILSARTMRPRPRKRKNKRDRKRLKEKKKREEEGEPSAHRDWICKIFSRHFAKCLIHDKWRLRWRPDSCEYRIKHVTNRIQFGEQDVRKLYKLRHRGENPGGPRRISRKLIAIFGASLAPFSRKSAPK